jgi:hypothetical protein
VKPHPSFAASALAAALALGGCERATVSEPVTHTPSLQVVSGTTQCVGGMSGTFDNVEVPPGGFCVLSNSTVRGNVKALQASRLHVFNGTNVRGNVEGDKAAVVQVHNSTIGGNIHIAEGVSPNEYGAQIVGTVVETGNIKIEKMNTGVIEVLQAEVLKGNIQLVENRTELLSVRFNAVAQNVQIFKNVNGRGEVNFNTGESVQCLENSEPFIGGPNTLASKREGQCF